MRNRSSIRRIGQALALAAALSCSLAFAAEPTLKQVYDTAQAGRLDEAQSMVQQVLIARPESAKAHFVHAELLAQQGKSGPAQEALRTAEKLAPGLPFAKPEAVQALRSRLSAKASTPAKQSSSFDSKAVQAAAAAAPAPAAGIPTGMLLLGGAAAVGLGIFLFRRKRSAATGAAAAYPASAAMAAPGAGVAPNGGQWGGNPQAPGMGMGGGMGPGMGYPGQQGSGMGGRIAGGLATGLAVGAGVMAAQAIGKTLTGGDEQPAAQKLDQGGAGLEPIPGGGDLGGQNFGVSDAGGWDDNAGGVDVGSDGGGDW